MKKYTTTALQNGILNNVFKDLYGKDSVSEQTDRYIKLINDFSHRFAADQALLFSSPGRSELCGNHTDHNRGRVVAAGIQLDKIAALVPRSDKKIEIVTEGFPDDIKTDVLTLEPDANGSGRASALVKGVAAYLHERGYRIGGFSAYLQSRVTMGSGLSSSASLEVLIGMIFNVLYNDGRIPPVELAKAGKYAENNYFHKPCGLMDQVACAVGGISVIDFMDENDPKIETLDFDFSDYGYQLMILDTGGDHADLTDEYASIPREMSCVAEALGCDVLRESSLDKLLVQAKQLRPTCGDRALLRAMHFFQENERVDAVEEAVRYHDMNSFLRIIGESGTSSWTLLQNCVPRNAVRDQAVSYALGFLKALCPNGIFRVHGGGFAGTVQGYVPIDTFAAVQETLEKQFGEGSTTALSIRSCGVIYIGEE